MIYAFDDYVLDTERFELRRANAPVPMEPQVFELLTHLIEGRDRVVSRDELFQQVWKGRFVSDAALSSRIKDARRAIGDDGTGQRRIRTIHGRGFRFVGDVRATDGASSDDRPAPSGLGAAERLAIRRSETLVAEVMARPAIAVLPFRDATAGAGASYLADGLTDEITAALCAWRYFPVISRNTAFRYRGTDATAKEIGREIGARYLLTGSVQCREAQLKVQAALIDCEDDRQMWSRRLVRPLPEVVDVEEELAERIVGMLEPEMRGAEMHRIVRKSVDDWTAWDLTMRALWCANRAGDDEHAEAIRLAEAAAGRAPDWYLPYALIAFVRFQRAMRSFSTADARTAFADTLDAARRALAIDQGSWLAHALTGVGELWTHRHHERALDHVHRAIELNPSACWTHHFAGCILGFSGDPAAARRLQARIFRIDPAYPYTAVIESDLGLWHLLDGEWDAAQAHLERAVQWDPAYGRALQRRVALGGLIGDRGLAQSALDRLAELGMPLTREQILTSYPFRNPVHRDTFFDGFRRAGLNL